MQSWVLAGKFSDESPIFDFSSAGPHFDSKVRPSICNGFTIDIGSSARCQQSQSQLQHSEELHQTLWPQQKQVQSTLRS